MKLNYRRTLLVGFAFFLICAFWQAYDTIIPKILTDKFGMSQTLSGFIMALDNILALFMLPFFGSLSDKCKSPRGKRTPFVVIGTIVACCALLLLSIADFGQTGLLEKVSPENYQDSLVELYDANPSVTPSGSAKKQPLSELFTKEAFTGIPMYDENGTVTDDYINYVVPTRQAYAAQVTGSQPTMIIFFVAALLIILIAMGTFRSPAVALMPDVTPKPLRSKGNAVINLMGAVGGILILVVGMIMGTGKTENAIMHFSTYFMVVTAVMLISLVIFVFTVKEPKWVADAEAVNATINIEPEEKAASGERTLSKGEKVSLILILASVALWYMGYNAVSSKYSVYAGSILNMDYSLPLMIAQAAAIASYIPVGIISSKVGRKKAILSGVAMLATAFLAASFATASTPFAVIILFFVLAGIGWATINVNSFPMVVELASGSNTGKYTGYYYTASMAAQTVTPVLSGIFLDINMRTLFPYATVFVVGSFITMLFVKHGDSKPKARGSALECLGDAMED